MTTNQAPGPADTLAEAQQRWKGEPPVNLTLTRGDAWLLLTAAQLRRRDFDIDYYLIHDLHRVGRAIQDAVCGPHDLDLRQVAEAGWDPTVDTVLASGEHTQPTMRYAFAIEDSQDGDSWSPIFGPSDDRGVLAGVEEVHDLGPTDFARRVLARWFARLRHSDTYDWQDESWYRCCVWDIAHAMDGRWGTGHPTEPAPHVMAQWLKANGCAPYAVEVRPPIQAVRDIEGSHLRSILTR